ncbi:hypothetical protein MSS4_04083 [Mycobacterium marinum]|nr:hypothetical protein MSS4_04083 [Mycobacterium marinum]
MTPREMDSLRYELSRRLVAHPSQEWPAELLRTLIAVFDMAYNDDPPRPFVKPHLVK